MWLQNLSFVSECKKLISMIVYAMGEEFQKRKIRLNFEKPLSYCLKLYSLKCKEENSK
jgi:hypothetical protein